MLTQEQILALDSKKHVKIYLLSTLGLSRKEIAEKLGTNPGHVGNEIKAYAKSKEKREKAMRLAGATTEEALTAFDREGKKKKVRVPTKEEEEKESKRDEPKPNPEREAHLKYINQKEFKIKNAEKRWWIDWTRKPESERTDQEVKDYFEEAQEIVQDYDFEREQKAIIDEVEEGDYVDFGAYGKLYVVKTSAGTGERNKWWVTDMREDRENQNASGWYIEPSYAKKILEKWDSDEAEDDDDDDSASSGTRVDFTFALPHHKHTPKLPLISDPIKFARDNKPTLLAFLEYAAGIDGALAVAANQCLLNGHPIAHNFTALADDKGWFIAINPTIEVHHGKAIEMKEQCLTFPGKNVIVKRYPEILVSYTDINGKERTRKAKGLEAQVWQHEIDHLNGVEWPIEDEGLHFRIPTGAGGMHTPTDIVNPKIIEDTVMVSYIDANGDEQLVRADGEEAKKWRDKINHPTA